MADNTKKETKTTDDITQDAKQRRHYTQSGKGPGEFGPDYSYRKEYHMRKKPPYTPHVREHFGDLGREYHTFEPNEAHNTQQPPLDIKPKERQQYDPHPIEPWVAPKKDHEGYDLP